MTGSLELKDSSKYSSTTVAIWRLSNAVMGLFFAFCSCLQHNDPDPEFWMPAYGIASLLCLCLAYRVKLQEYLLWRIFCGLELAICLVLAAYVVLYVSESTQLAQHGYNPMLYEEGRELAGLGIVLSWLTACLLFQPHKAKTDSKGIGQPVAAMLVLAFSLVPFGLYAICMVGALADQITYCQHMCGSSHG